MPPSRARRGLQLLLVAVGAFALTLGPAVLAVQLVQGGSPTHDYLAPTDNYDVRCTEGEPGTGAVCRTDNATVTWFVATDGELGLEAPDLDALLRGLDQNYRGLTDLAFRLDSTPVFDGDDETDLVYEEGSLPDAYVGYTWCDDNVADYRCDQTVVRFLEDAISPGLVCHETGHAFGLVHGDRTTPLFDNQDEAALGCMVKNAVPVTATIRPAQVDDIDDVY